MSNPDSNRILVSGAGVAGLTAALALAHKGYAVSVYEKAPALSEVGAGLQLAPNATRILDRLGVLGHLLSRAVTPDALYLRDGRSAKVLMRMALGSAARHRWHAPYLVCHRADLQTALLAACKEHPTIEINSGCDVIADHDHPDGVQIEINKGGSLTTQDGILLLGCDGVWSARRNAHSNGDEALFSGNIAWRATLPRNAVPHSFQSLSTEPNAVSAWLGKRAHFISYPVKAGAFFNFVAITHGNNPGKIWSSAGNKSTLSAAFSGWNHGLRDVIDTAETWTYWPLFAMKKARFIEGSYVVLLGDAAHAMTPFAAQGAAMAIEDAAALAQALGDPNQQPSKHWPERLKQFEKLRQYRIAAVARRGALNRFAYHATGPLALGRNILFKMRSPESFMVDLDWLYDYDASAHMKD